MRLSLVTVAVLLSMILNSTPGVAQWHGPDVPDSLSFQGFLADTSGTAVADDAYDLLFKMYKGSTKIWQQNHSGVQVKSGGFSVILTGSVTWPLDTVAFSGPIDLGIAVNGGSELVPRTPLTSSAYALAVRGLHSVWVDDGLGDKSQTIVAGASNNEITDKAIGAVISGGGGWSSSGSVANKLTGNWTVIAGGRSNQVVGNHGVIGGGLRNSTWLGVNVVGGGQSNRAWGHHATVSGGFMNFAGYDTVLAGPASYATIGGGWDNYAPGNYATIAGGRHNVAKGGTISGGDGNFTSGGTVGGGTENSATGGTIGGGFRNETTGSSATIAGGYRNSTSGLRSTIGGGYLNIASGDTAAIAGGGHNTAGGKGSAVSGGSGNSAAGDLAAIGGGGGNAASGFGAVVNGGEANSASGNWATVAGGFWNFAAGSYSYAAGRRARASHDGTFVWSDNDDLNFLSTGSNQFLIRAAGGVGIGTNSPQGTLHVSAGDTGDTRLYIEADSDNNKESDNPLIALIQDGGITGAYIGFDETNFGSNRFGIGRRSLGSDFWDVLAVNIGTGNLGLGTNSPTEKLHVNGNIYSRGHMYLYAFEGDGSSGTAYIMARDKSGSSTIGMNLRTQDAGVTKEAIVISASGDVHVLGALSKGSGSFKIDHPLDPENKYLYHSFVESPDMMNVYNGNVILGQHGNATIKLPSYFEALNQDFRYQLTCIGGFAPVFIAEKISGNRFSIAGGTPGMEVSWQITGIRKDPYAEQHRIEVEVEKSPDERGTYLHPEAYPGSN